MTVDRRDPDRLAVLRGLGRDVPDSDTEAKNRARARLQRVIEAESRRPRRAMPALAIAAAILASLAVVLVVVHAPDREGQPALLRLATVAFSQPAPSIPAGSFAYLSVRVVRTSAMGNVDDGREETVVVELIRETWMARDGSGLIVEHPIGAPGDATRFEAAPGELRFVELNGLPTEPGALLEALRAPGLLDEPEDDLEVLSGIAAFFRDAYASPAHRRTLFEIVQGIEGVEVTEGFLDPSGRSGTAVSLSDEMRSVTLVFDPETSRLLFEGESRTDGTFSETTYLRVGVVTAAGERPIDTIAERVADNLGCSRWRPPCCASADDPYASTPRSCYWTGVVRVPPAPRPTESGPWSSAALVGGFACC
jgi:hypothetical protein